MLCGRMLPELGGSREHLDIIGINYYWTNQWEHTRPGIPLRDDDPRRAPLRDLVRGVWERYGGELMISETSHRDEMRPVWLRELAVECEALLAEGVPLQGVCLYPILGMPEWHARSEWSRMGLWDLVEEGEMLRRVACRKSLAAFKEAQRLEYRRTGERLLLAA
jgi:beta-glucosidase/6-phospho-beta-glucosidase/beta-galactosidase